MTEQSPGLPVTGPAPGLAYAGFGVRVVAWIIDAVALVGLIISFAVLLLGVIWVAFDSRKQGWHDKMANTVVVRPA